MKKSLGLMALGAGVGAGMMFMVEQLKNGNLSKTVNKGTKAMNKIRD